MILLTIILSINPISISCLVERVVVTPDRLYYFHSLRRTFASSLTLCRSKGMRLAIPRSEGEDKNISDYAMDGPPGSCQESPWLGGIFKGDKDDMTVTWLTSSVTSRKSDRGKITESDLGTSTESDLETSTESSSKPGSDDDTGGTRHDIFSSQPDEVDAEESGYQNGVIDETNTCKPRGGGHDAVRQAKSLACKDGSQILIWWRYPRDNIHCLSTTMCELEICGLEDRRAVDALSNTSTLLQEFLERTEEKEITLLSLAAMNDFLQRRLATMDVMESFYQKITSKEQSRMESDRKTGPMKKFYILLASLAPIIILIVIGHFRLLVSPLTTNECPTSQDRNAGRRLPSIPPRVGPEELYEEIDAYRDYLALSALEDQYLPMDQHHLDQQKKRVLQGKDSTATESSNSYVS